jgi:hypothetical protein
MLILEFVTLRSFAIVFNEGSNNLSVSGCMDVEIISSQYIAVAIGEKREANDAVRTIAFFCAGFKML